MAKYLTADQVLKLMRERQGERTNQAFARELQVSPQYLGDVYAGRRDIGSAIWQALGLTRHVLFTRDSQAA